MLNGNCVRSRSICLALGFGVLFGGTCLLLVGPNTEAQIDRSRPPSAPPASSGGQGGRSPSTTGNGGTPRADRGRTLDGSSSASHRMNRGRTADGTSRDSGTTGNERGGTKILDRYNRTKESAAARGPSESNTHIQFLPYYPFGYFPGGFDPYGYPSNPYPSPYPYPSPDPYPSPRGGYLAIAKYDSPYFYCDDLAGGQYVNGSTAIISKPKRLYTPTPVYTNGELTEWRDLGSDDYLGGRNVENTAYRVREQPAADAALDTAVADIRESWIQGSVEPLARHLRKELPVAIILHGKYLYSLEAGDLLEVTRAAYSAAVDLRFILDHLHRRADNTYTLTGRHIYTDSNNKDRAVYFSYVLVKIQSEYVIPQLASTPERD